MWPSHMTERGRRHGRRGAREFGAVLADGSTSEASRKRGEFHRTVRWKSPHADRGARPVVTARSHRGHPAVTKPPQIRDTLPRRVSKAARRPLRSLPAPGDRPTAPHLRSLRLRLADGAWTTLHVATYRPATTAARVVRFPTPTPLAAWCAANDAPEAVVGGFFVRASGVPL